MPRSRPGAVAHLETQRETGDNKVDIIIRCCDEWVVEGDGPAGGITADLRSVVRGGEWSTKEYKGRTDSNSPTGPNEAVCLATLLLL